MSEVVDFTSKFEGSKETKRLNKYYDLHDQALNYCEELFPEGVVILAISNGELQMSATVEDGPTVLEIVEAAYEVIYKRETE